MCEFSIARWAPRAEVDDWSSRQTNRKQDCSGYTAGAQNIPFWIEISHDRPSVMNKMWRIKFQLPSIVVTAHTYFKCVLKHFWYKNYISDNCMRDGRFVTDHLRSFASKFLKTEKREEKLFISRIFKMRWAALSSQCNSQVNSAVTTSESSTQIHPHPTFSSFSLHSIIQKKTFYVINQPTAFCLL